MSIYGHDKHDGENHCNGCKFWERKEENKETGLCLRFPPSPLVMIDDDGSQLIVSVYPETETEHWCGEFCDA